MKSKSKEKEVEQIKPGDKVILLKFAHWTIPTPRSPAYSRFRGDKEGYEREAPVGSVAELRAKKAELPNGAYPNLTLIRFPDENFDRLYWNFSNVKLATEENMVMLCLDLLEDS